MEHDAWRLYRPVLKATLCAATKLAEAVRAASMQGVLYASQSVFPKYASAEDAARRETAGTREKLPFPHPNSERYRSHQSTS